MSVVEMSEAPKLRIVVVGHVDHGKSTLIGRIFYDTDSLPEGKVEAIKKASALEGMEFEYAFLLDALLEEQAQNITIDTTQIPFRTEKRGYVLIDAPGHREFLKNMVTGAASADAAILLVAANEGVREQSRRHGYLLRLLGLRQIVVAVNKMDLVDYSEAAFEAVKTEYTDFLTQIGLTAQQFIPISAREGDNIARRASDKMPWYDGPTILQRLDQFAPAALVTHQPLRFPVQDIFRFDARRIIAGRVESGTLRIGDRLRFSPGGRESRVASFERWQGPARDYALAGESVAITLEEQLFVERGQIASLSGASTPTVAHRLRVNLFWMGPETVKVGDKLRLRLATQEVGCRIATIERRIDASTLADADGDTTELARHDVAEAIIETDKPIAFDTHDISEALGRFVLVLNRRVAGGGILTGADILAEDRNIVPADSRVSRQERERRNGHKGAVVWLTGLSGSGKSTLASAVNRTLFDHGISATFLDGDNLRHGLNADLGFSPEDRSENIRRAAHVAALFAESGVIALTAFISPYRNDRQNARAIALQADVPFIEIFVDTPLEVCESRDPKGLYKKARAGEIPQFTGIDAPYETPEAPEVTIRTAEQSQEESVATLVQEIRERLSNSRYEDWSV
jgi:bifunctional enzyme CysN/CysC